MNNSLQARLEELAVEFAVKVQQIIRSVPLRELAAPPPKKKGRPKGSKNKS